MRTMDNWTFHRDYSSYWDELMKDEDDISESDLKLIETMHDYQAASPKFINPTAPKCFDHVIKLTDEYASNIGGIVDATIDYEAFEAHVDLQVPYFEFGNEEDKGFMMEIAMLCGSINISPKDNGWLHMRMTFPYFITAHTQEERAQFNETMKRIVNEALSEETE